jgi:hypothetical protein
VPSPGTCRRSNSLGSIESNSEAETPTEVTSPNVGFDGLSAPVLKPVYDECQSDELASGLLRDPLRPGSG